jgi:hypothetical protein
VKNKKKKAKNKEKKVKNKTVQKTINMFTVSNKEIKMSALSYLITKYYKN